MPPSERLAAYAQSLGVPGSVAPGSPQPIPNASPEAGPQVETLPLNKSQFSYGLSTQEAMSFCGPAAALAFARHWGRNPTAQEAQTIAERIGWTPGQGMTTAGGISGEKRLLDEMQIPNQMVAADPGDKWIVSQLRAGNPVIISTGIHYYVADDYDERTGQVHVGTSGTDRSASSGVSAEWLHPEQIRQADGGINGALVTTHPEVRQATQAAARNSTPEQQFLSRVYKDAREAGHDEDGARAAVAVAQTEGGMGGVQGDKLLGGARGTFQFNFGGGQGNNYARQHGITDEEADRLLSNDPHAGNAWALGKGGYLGEAIRKGQAMGLHGAALATHAQEFGQVSERPETSGRNYEMLYGGGGSGPSDVGQQYQGNDDSGRPGGAATYAPATGPEGPGGEPRRSRVRPYTPMQRAALAEVEDFASQQDEPWRKAAMTDPYSTPGWEMPERRPSRFASDWSKPFKAPVASIEPLPGFDINSIFSSQTDSRFLKPLGGRTPMFRAPNLAGIR